MKIMFYINTLAGGGAQRVMANLANLFQENGDEVIFVTSYPVEKEYALSDGIIRKNLSEERIPSKVSRNVAYIRGLRDVVLREKPEVLISFMGEPNIRAVLATRGLPVKTIISVRNDPNKEYAGKVNRFLSKTVLPLAEGCVFQTEEASLWFPEKLQAKSTIIMNAVKKEFFETAHDPVPGRIITCGRLHKQKNHRLMIDAFSEVVNKHDNLELLIYGEGDLKDTLSQYIEEKGLCGHVKLMGQISDVPGALSQASCFVMTSDYEGMPNALMEAMAVGVPSISTDCPCGGARMLIRHKENGLLVPVGDKMALVDAMDTLFSDSAFADELGNNAKQSAEAFLPAGIFDQWNGYISRIVSRQI